MRGLRTSFRVDIHAVLLRVGQTWQNDIGLQGAEVAMMSLVHDKSVAIKVLGLEGVVGAQQVDEARLTAID